MSGEDNKGASEQMITAFVGLMNSIQGSHQAAMTMFGAHEAQMRLINRIGPNMNNAQIRDVFERDLRLSLAAESAKVRFAAYNAQQKMYQQMIKKHLEMQENSNRIWYG